MKFFSLAITALVAASQFSSSLAVATANPDSVNTPVNVPATINVLANDFREPAPTAPARPAVPGTDTVTMLSTPTPSGTVVVDANGVVTYTPVTGFKGTASFTYVFTVIAASDANNGQTATGTVTVTVGPVPLFGALSSASAVALTQNTLLNFGTRGATSQAQFQNALFPVLNAPVSFFPVFNATNTPAFASGLNSVNANFAFVFANFNFRNPFG